MSPGLAIERHPTPNFERGRGGERPAGVVVHTTVGGWMSVIRWFSQPESGVSSHYLVGLDGEVAQFVDEADTARHCGRVAGPTARLVREREANPNAFTIGIEFEDGGEPFEVVRPDSQYEAGAALIAAASARWAIPLDRDHVIGHREIYSKKGCPGNLDVGRLIAEAAALGA